MTVIALEKTSISRKQKSNLRPLPRTVEGGREERGHRRAQRNRTAALCSWGTPPCPPREGSGSGPYQGRRSRRRARQICPPPLLLPQAPPPASPPHRRDPSEGLAEGLPSQLHHASSARFPAPWPSRPPRIRPPQEQTASLATENSA